MINSVSNPSAIQSSHWKRWLAVGPNNHEQVEGNPRSAIIAMLAKIGLEEGAAWV
jgi:hypothetical protein